MQVLTKYLSKVILAVTIAFASIDAIGQNVKINEVVQETQKVKISYSLNGTGPYSVKLYYAQSNYRNSKHNDLNWIYASQVSGDCGENQRGSTEEKTITWHVLNEREELVGKYDFKIIATDNKAQAKQIETVRKANEKAEDKRRKDLKKQSFNFASSSLNYSCNFGRAPFGASFLLPFWQKRTGIYIDLKTDFRYYAPGEATRRGSIEKIGAHKTGYSQASRGGTDLTSAFYSQLIGEKNYCWALLFGATLSFTPTFDEWVEDYSYNTYFIKDFSEIYLYPIWGVTYQGLFDWSYGFTARVPAFFSLGLNSRNREDISFPLTLFIGGTF